ncbi:hypothetical protein C440_05817 [Haloferax mucosum ATCC BAA-1512]|uniref:Uncharacterized protein n=1 Tax=Haloferax mucosum ATCC BAA-1512 TaxID=662479 RepID=M0IJR1_9EURY|nr:hypothetical protein [Haloferax mucosum]ELZ96083.1 hypothetical protein C440_05817 [Haloferax mucosum ATCC BAA-1512]
MSTTISTDFNGTKDRVLNQPDVETIDLEGNPLRTLVHFRGKLQVATLSRSSWLMGPDDDRTLVQTDRGYSGACWVGRPTHVFDEDYLELGVDSEGATHVWNVWDNVVHVVAGGDRKRTEDLDATRAGDALNWVAFVADRRGWADLHPIFTEVRE